MSYIGLLIAYGLAVIPRTLPHLKKYGGYDKMMKWSTLTSAEKCDFKNYLTSEDYNKKLEVYDAGKTTTFALTGIKAAEDWNQELMADIDEVVIDRWITGNNC